MGLLGKFFAKFSRNEFTEADERDLANVLIESDLGNTLSTKILDAAKTHKGESASSAVRAVLRSDRKSTRLNSSHIPLSRMPSSA